MAIKSEKPVPVSAIKWTDEEWGVIAKQLYATMGTTLLTPERLDEVKAKDVFLAQEKVLAEHRHRKLISISQGFQAIRQKLYAILVKTSDLQQENLFDAKSEQATTTSGQQSEVAVDSEKVVPAASAIQQVAVPSTPAEKQTTTDGGTIDDAAPRFSQQNAMENAVNAAAANDRKTSDRTAREAMRGQTIPETHHVAHARQRASTPDQSGSTRKPAPLDSTSFTELARPFVAMVCQELANALIDALSKETNKLALSAVVQQAMSQATTGQQKPAGRAHLTPRTHQPLPPALHAEPAFPLKPKSDVTVQRHVTIEEDEDDGDGENDVQPLFDPKLPPSANSSFKPIVGVVGASAQDFSDLQLMYPQLALTAVAVDDVPHAHALEQCQRVIGLREDVPFKTDEVLRNTFRNRYLRLTGGMARVREQLDAWLDQPGATEPRRPKFNKPRGNKGSSGAPKKRNGNFQRPPR